MLDERRWALPAPTGAQLRLAMRGVGEAMPGLLLAMADIEGMPSGLHAAYIAGMSALGRAIRWPTAGAAAAMLLRLASGLAPRWENLLTLGILLGAQLLPKGRSNRMLLLTTALALLPMVVRGWFASTAMEMIMCWLSVLLSTMSAPVLCRGVKALTARNREGQTAHIETMEDRLGVIWLGLMMMAGGARLLIGVNVGVMLATAAVTALAIHFGPGAGCAAGIMTGTVLMLMGLPAELALALSAGGYLAGVLRELGRRWMICIGFAGVSLIVMMLTGAAGMGCSGAVILVSTLGAVLPDDAYKPIRAFLRRLRVDQPQSGNAYAASMLAAWEKTVEAMAMSVPVPGELPRRRDGGWWARRLCEGCPEGGFCGFMATEDACDRAEYVWAQRAKDDAAWENSLEALRGLGCQRLYHLRQGMDALRQEEAARSGHRRRMHEQRNMLVTHLSAMAGAARRFAHLSAGENWWDAAAAARIRRALADDAAPARLMWIRRVQGHVRAAFSLEELTGTRRHAEALCALVSEATGARMMLVGVDGDVVCLAEQPPLEALCGVCTVCADGQQVCGDTAWFGLLQDGRFMAAACDGMGHGEDAALSSRQTVELLRLCLDAGYTLQQTLTAVNGMMLMGGSGEQFIAVDLATIDLWSGQLLIEKMGAAGSWVLQCGSLLHVSGDALPLGILENAEAGEQLFHLAPGDCVVLLTDGVEEAFGGRSAIQEAVRIALDSPTAQEAAESLMDAAQAAQGGQRRDDQSVIVIRMASVQKKQGDV